jgi:SPW repeat-containing protein
MKIISRKVHGFLDYLVAIVLIAIPLLFGFADDGPATYIPVALGAGALVYSILTDYECGLVPLIPFRVHLLIDVLSGAFLAISPWLFGFSNKVYLPHLIFGLIEIGAGIMTRDSSEVPGISNRVRT